MNERQGDLETARDELGRIVAEAEAGERFTITRDGKKVAVVISYDLWRDLLDATEE